MTLATKRVMAGRIQSASRQFDTPGLDVTDTFKYAISNLKRHFCL